MANNTVLSNLHKEFSHDCDKLCDLIADISGTQQDDVNWKMSLRTMKIIMIPEHVHLI